VIGLRERFGEQAQLVPTRVAIQARTAVGALLIATGAVFLVLELRGRGHGHSLDEHGGHGHGHGRGGDHDDSLGYDHGHGHHREPAHEDDHVTATIEIPASAPPRHEHSRRRAARLLAFAVPFGAAASPDLTILPVFLAAVAVGLVCRALSAYFRLV
jgi:nickel/cobalt exporter